MNRRGLPRRAGALAAAGPLFKASMRHYGGDLAWAEDFIDATGRDWRGYKKIAESTRTPILVRHSAYRQLPAESTETAGGRVIWNWKRMPEALVTDRINDRAGQTSSEN